MAERRMFTNKITESDPFLDMPLSSQALYFHLCMYADDDGFVKNPKRICRMIGVSDDDFKLLIAKSFVLNYESGVIVIKHWRMHNLLRKDRYNETEYVEEKSMLYIKDNGAYTLDENQGKPLLTTKRQPNGNQMATQDSIGEDSIGKDNYIPSKEGISPPRNDYQSIINKWNEICVSFPKVTSLSEARKKAINARLKTYTVDDLIKAFNLAEESDFLKGKNDRNWSANFDWIIKDTNLAKVLDGNYKNKTKGETANDGSTSYQGIDFSKFG